MISQLQRLKGWHTTPSITYSTDCFGCKTSLATYAGLCLPPFFPDGSKSLIYSSWQSVCPQVYSFLHCFTNKWPSKVMSIAVEVMQEWAQFKGTNLHLQTN